MDAPRDVPSKASRPVLSGRGRPLPASCFVSVRAGVHCLHARAPIIDQLPVVVAHSSSVPGRFESFCSLELACQVYMCWFSAFHASMKLCAPYIL